MRYLAEQLLNGLSLGCIYALIALGFAMVYGVLKLLNFAHSEIFASGTFIAYFTLQSLGSRLSTSPVAAIGLTLLAASVGTGLIAVLLERVAYRPLRQSPSIETLLSAIGVSIVMQTAGIRLFTAHTRGFPAVALPIAPRLFAVTTLAVALCVLYVVVYHTDLGIRMRSVSEKPHIASLMGVDPNRIIVAAFFIGGFFAGTAGVVWGVVYGTVHPQMGFYPALKAFVIAVVGSIGNIMGTFVIGVALGMAEALLAAYLPPSASGFRDSFVLAVLLITLALRPQGIFGRADRAKV